MATAIASDRQAVTAKAPLSRPAWPWSSILLALAVLGLCVLPFVLVLTISVGEKIEGAGWVWGFDLSNYERFFVGIDWPNSISFLYSQKLFYSLYYAAIASLLAVATAFPFTYLMTRQSRAAQTGWLVILLAVFTFSEVFIVMGWDVLLSNRSGLPMLFRESGLTDWLKETGWFDVLRSWGLASPRNVKFKTSEFATILALTSFVWPYAVILLYPALSRLDQDMIEAARTMRAGPLTVIRTVVVPLVRLPIVGAVLLLFVFLLGAYVAITVFAAPAKQTLTISIYEAIRGSTLNAPFGAAQAIVLLVTASILLAASTALARHAEAKR